MRAPTISPAIPALFGLCLAGFATGLYCWRHYLVDDAFMFFRYAEHVARGNGIVWNIGEHPVEGFSSPLWLFLLLLPALAGADLHIVGVAVGVVVSALLIPACMGAFARRLPAWQGTGWARFVLLLPAALLLLNRPTLLHALSCMDTTPTLVVYWLTILLVGEAAASTSAQTFLWVAAWAFLVSLARSESLFVSVLFLGVLGLAWRDKRAIQAGAVFAGAAITWYAWKLHYFGHLLPTPFYYKAATGDGQFWMGAGETLPFLRDYALAPLAVYALGLVVHRRRASPTEIFCLGAAACSILLAFRVRHVMGYEYRFSWHGTPFLFALGLNGMGRLLEVAAGREAPRGRRAAAATLSLLLPVALALKISPWCFLPWIHPELLAGPINTDTYYYANSRRIGKLLGEMALPPSTLINGQEAGIIPYYSHARALDLIGLNDEVLTHGTAEEKRRHLSTHPIDIDFCFAGSEGLDDFAMPRTPEFIEESRLRFAERVRHYYYAGSWDWNPDPTRRFLHFWVRRDYADAARVTRILRQNAPHFFTGVAWGSYDPETLRLLGDAPG